MEPEVRYCTTTDGVRIAYAIAGSGPPLLYGVEPITSHMQLEWSHTGSGRILRRHAQHNTLIRLDFRGSGLSDRVTSQSLDEGVLDVEAVVERAGFEQFALYANLSSVPTMILFAARHPERVSRMVIVDGYVRFADILSAQPPGLTGRWRRRPSLSLLTGPTAMRTESTAVRAGMHRP